MLITVTVVMIISQGPSLGFTPTPFVVDTAEEMTTYEM
jgi:hypothetical protein